MYKFTNGVVVYDEITRDKYIKSGMTLVKEEVKEIKEEKKEENNGDTESRIEPIKFGRTTKRTEKFGRSHR